MNIMMPKITVVTPSFNQAPFLEACLRSVLDQNYPNLEYIVIDGGSTDGSVEIIQNYAARLAYWVSEPDSGHGDALNKGFSHSTGDILCWLNSDDMQTPWTLRTVAEIFEQFQHIDWIQGWNSFWTEHGVMVHPMKNPKNIYRYLNRDYHWIQQESVFWRRSLWAKAGSFINPEYTFLIDVELWTRFFLLAELYSVDAVLGGWRNTGENRALRYQDECHHEALQAISTMEQQLDHTTKKRSRAFRLMTRLRKSPLEKYARLGRMIASLPPVRNLYRTASYKEIRWHDDLRKWHESTSEFYC